METIGEQEMLTRIYEEIADKTLNFGVIIEGIEGQERQRLRFVCSEEEKAYQPRWMHVNSEEWSFMMPEEGWDYKIIGHPVLLGDAIQYANMIVGDSSKHFDYTEEIEAVEKSILQNWIYYTKPIEDQPMEAIELLYSLLPTK